MILALTTAVLLWLASGLKKDAVPELPDGTKPVQSEAAAQGATQPGLWDSAPEFEVEDLSDGLCVTDVGSYAGIYMEDGSDEPVSNVLMMVLENTSEKDLQLARIQLAYSDFTAEFEATNLPAGESVVLLEKNRRDASEEEYQSAVTSDVVFFDEPMSLQEDHLSVSGYNGGIQVTNISDGDISGDIVIYYKNSAGELLYGGITYRARVEGGIAAGETARIMTGHYTPDHCRILWITCSE